MDLARFPRRRYTEGWTPLEHLPHLTQLMGGPHIFIKRDDLLGLTAGGNKTRKLEFLVADALRQGADTLITVGAVQSNHCRLTLAAAVKEGMKCRLVLEQRVPDSYDYDASGNNFLFRLLGVEKMTVVDLGTDLGAAMQAEADEAGCRGAEGIHHPRRRIQRHRGPGIRLLRPGDPGSKPSTRASSSITWSAPAGAAEPTRAFW